MCGNFFIILKCIIFLYIFEMEYEKYEASEMNGIECNSIDIRNNCHNLLSLQNCTVIKGSLTIALLPKNRNDIIDMCDYTKYTFPLLREITDYLILFDIKGLESLNQLFPNLLVIRGRRLFLNYALSISNLPDLREVEFKSLKAIQRGHVFIGSNPSICDLEKIDWDRLTLTKGENHIYPIGNCSNDIPCTKSYSSLCKNADFDRTKYISNTSLINNDYKYCHKECMGGCYNKLSSDCYACKGLSDHGVCVNKCPKDKYLSEHYQRCFTREECIHEQKRYIFESSCISYCPHGYKSDSNRNCLPCLDELNECNRTCQPTNSNVITIYNLADTDLIKGCKTINGSLVISLRSKINENDLFKNFQHLQVINGHLKIYRNPHLTSLQFLQNLQKINGTPLESNLYGLIIYDNDKLTDLWKPKNSTIITGSLYIHLNNKLCNNILKDFKQNLIYDNKLDTIQINDYHLLCGKSTFRIHLEHKTHSTFTISWQKKDTENIIEILHRPVTDELSAEIFELQNNVCSRIHWIQRFLYKNDLKSNITHYYYTIDGLRANTKYMYFIKVFNTMNDDVLQSDKQFVITDMDTPIPPQVKLIKKTYNSLTLALNPSRDYEHIDYFYINVYENVAADIKAINKRNYCQDPIVLLQHMPLIYSVDNLKYKDFDNCCSNQIEKQKYSNFLKNLRNNFACSRDNLNNCMPKNLSLLPYQKPLRSEQLHQNISEYKIEHLQSFHLYILQIYACNNINCSTPSLLMERTTYRNHTNKFRNLTACNVPGTYEYHVYFPEPDYINDIIVAYVLHYRTYERNNRIYTNHYNCITRLEHLESNYQHISIYNVTFKEISVHILSVASRSFSGWFNITECKEITNYKTKIQVAHKSGINIFLMCFLLGAACCFLWVCYKRQYWRKIFKLKRYIQRRSPVLVPVRRSSDDNQLLIDNFETVHFRNDNTCDHY